MADIETTADVQLDMRLREGKLIDSGTYLAAMAKRIEALKLPKTILTPEIVLKGGSKQLDDSIRKFNTAVAKRLQDSTIKVSAKYDKVLSPLNDADLSSGRFQSRLKAYQKVFSELQKFNNLLVPAQFEKYGNAQFENILKAAKAGQNIEKTFGKKAYADLQNYYSLLEQIGAQFRAIDRTLASSKGITTEKFTVGKGEEKRTIPAQQATPAVLAPELRTLDRAIKEELTSLRKSTSESAQSKQLLAEQNRAALQAARLARENERQRIAFEKDADRRDKIALQNQRANIGQQALRVTGGDISALPTSALGNVAAALGRDLGLVERRYAELARQVRSGTAKDSDLKVLDEQAVKLRADLDKVKQRLADVRTAAKHEVAASRQPKGRDVFADLGDQIIARQGGSYRDVAGIGRDELHLIEAALARRRQAIEAQRETLRTSGVVNPETRAEVKRLSAELGQLDLALTRTRQRMTGFGSVTQQTGALFRQFFRYALGYGALYQALAAIRALIGGVIDLNKSLKSIQAVTGATLDDMRKIDVGIKQVALSTKFGVNEIAQAGQVLAQAGVKPEDFINVLDSVATFAAATESSIETAADLVSTMRNVFKELDDVTVANQLTKAVNISKLTAEDLKTILSRGAQVAKDYNLTSEQFLSAVTVLRNAGLRASTVATGLRAGLIELLSPDEKTLQVLKTRYTQLGETLSGEAIQARFFAFRQTSNPLLAVLREFQRLGFSGAAKQQFSRVFDVRAANAITALVDNLDQLQEAQTKLTFGNSALKASQTQMEALANSVSNLGAAITVLSAQMGEGLVKDLDSVVDSATNLIQTLTKLDAQIRAQGGAGFGTAAVTGIAGGLAAAATGTQSGFLARGAKFLAGTAIGASAGVIGQEAAAGAGGGSGASLFASIFSSVISAVLFADLFKAVKTIFTRTKDLSQHFSAVANVAGDAATAAAAAPKGLQKVVQFFKSLALPRLSGLFAVAKLHPITAGLSTLVSIVTGLYLFMKDPTLNEVKDKLDQALKNFDAAVATRDKQLQEFSEFKLGTSTAPAKAGSTAESVDKLSQGVVDLDTQLSKTFNISADKVQQVRDLLIRLSREGFEANSELRRSLIDELKQITRVTIGKGSVTDQQLQALSNAAADQQSSTQALQQSIREQIVQLTETTDSLTLVQKATLYSFRELAGRSEETYSKLVGFTEASPQEMAALSTELLKGIEDFFTTSTAAKEYAQEVNAAAKVAIDSFAEAVLKSDTKEQVRELMLQLSNSLDKLDSSINDYLNDLIIGLGQGLPEDIRRRLENSQPTINRRPGSRPRPAAAGPVTKEEKASQTLIELSKYQNTLQNSITLATLQLEEFKRAVAAGEGPNRRTRTVTGRRLEQQLETLQEELQKNSRSLFAARQATEKSILQDADLKSYNDKLLKQRDTRREATLSIINSPAFIQQQESLAPSQKKLVQEYRDKAFPLVPEIKTGIPTGRKQFSAGFNAVNTLADQFVESVTKEIESKVFVPPKELQLKAQVLETSLKEAERTDLARAAELRTQLGQVNLKLKALELDFYSKLSRVDEVKPDTRAKFQNKTQEAQNKINELAAQTEEKNRDTRLELLDREKVAAQRRTKAEEEYANKLQDQINQAEISDPKKLTTLDDKNPLVLLSKLRQAQLDRQMKQEQKLADNKDADEKARIAARNAALDLEIQIDQERVNLKREVNKNEKSYTDKRRSEELDILKSQKATIEKSLDYALAQGNQARVQQLLADRVDLYKKIRDVEREQLLAAGTTAQNLKQFDKVTQETLLSMNNAADIAKQTVKALKQRYEQLQPRPKEYGSFERVGVARARGTPLSRESRLSVIQAELAIQKDQLNNYDKLLKAMKDELARKGVSPEQQKVYAETGTITFPSTVTNDQQNKLTDMLDAMTRFQHETEDAKIKLGELDEKAKQVSGDIFAAFRSAFSIKDLASSLEQSRYAIENIGRTIQDELVKGFDDTTDAIANAIVEGDNFTKGFKIAVSDMLKAIAKDLIKSGLTEFFTTLVRGNLFSTGNTGTATGGGFTGAQVHAGGAQGGGSNTSGYIGLALTLASLFLKKGGIVQAMARGGKIGGGIIRGKGTGTSDSIIGGVYDNNGKFRRGIAVSNKEGILNAMAVKTLGEDFVHFANENPKALAAMLRQSAGVSHYASGGIVSDIQSTSGSATLGGKSVVEHTFNSNIKLEASPDSGISNADLDRLDKGLNARVSEYVQQQLRPGGLLSAARR